MYIRYKASRVSVMSLKGVVRYQLVPRASRSKARLQARCHQVNAGTRGMFMGMCPQTDTAFSSWLHDVPAITA